MNIFHNPDMPGDSLNLDDIFTKSVDMNSLNKTDMSSKTIQKYFIKSLKLRNVSKKVCWNRNTSTSNVKIFPLIFLDIFT
ncbi:MAG: hypothetical protein MJ252_05475 [archaeon]|nr:hypothetical protein [archaeon]